LYFAPSGFRVFVGCVQQVTTIDKSTEGIDWSSCLHFADILPIHNQLLPPPFLIPPLPQQENTTNLPIDSIASDIRIIHDATKCQLLRDIQNEDPKKDNQNSWDKLPDVVQDMILKLTAMVDDCLPPGLTESYY
jgi:hypothetical protein